MIFVVRSIFAVHENSKCRTHFNGDFLSELPSHITHVLSHSNLYEGFKTINGNPIQYELMRKNIVSLV